MAKAELRALISADARAFNRTMGRIKQTISRTAAFMGGIAVTGGIFATREAISFEQQMAKVNTIAKLTPEALKKMSQEVLALGVETGKTANQLTDGLYQALSAGVPAGNAIDFLRTSAKAATAGATEVGAAAKLIASQVTASGKSFNQAGEIADALFTTVVGGITEFPLLAASIGKATPIATAAGIAYDDLNASIMTMTKATGLTAESVTSIKAAIQALLKPTPILTEAFENLGVSSGTELIKKFGGLSGALNAISGEFGGNVSQIAKAIGSQEALLAVTSLSGDKFAGAQADLALYTSKLGANETAFRMMAGTTQFQIDIMKTSVQGLAITIGQELLTALAPVGPAIQSAISDPETLANLKLMVELFANLAASIIAAVNALFRFGEAAANIIPGIKNLADPTKEIAASDIGQAVDKIQLKGLRKLRERGGGVDESLLADSQLQKLGLQTIAAKNLSPKRISAESLTGGGVTANNGGPNLTSKIIEKLDAIAVNTMPLRSAGATP